MGAKYKFDGTKLIEKNRSTTIANVRGDKIHKGSSSGAPSVANVRGDKIHKGSSSGAPPVANVRYDWLCSGSSSSRICKMKDIHNEIEGPGEAIKAALWWYFVK
jgi:hypothetical protein|tara:strand:+ start:451 stop:762 length:312 start_codon:yes stop_codon:yes gene_type:complete